MLLPTSHTTDLVSQHYSCVSVSYFLQPEQLTENLESGFFSSSSSSALLLSQQDDSNLLNDVISTLDISQHPILTVLVSYILVTASDMIPFVPCQPLAIALGAKFGFMTAFPITTLGQTTAGILAFVIARKASNTDLTKQITTEQLSQEAQEKFIEFRQMTTSEQIGDDNKILLALIGLRLAPFFPFSAGNYLLGATTAVPLYLFIIATIMGCIASNFISVSIGAGASTIIFSS